MKKNLQHIIEKNPTGLDQTTTHPPTWFRYTPPILFIILPKDQFKPLNHNEIEAIWTHFRVQLELNTLICDPGFPAKTINHNTFIILIYATTSNSRTTQKEITTAWQHLTSTYPINYSPVPVAENKTPHHKSLPYFTQSQQRGTAKSPSPVSVDAKTIIKQLAELQTHDTSKA